MIETTLQAERQHLAELIEAIQRCVFFLDASIEKLVWPLTKAHLENNKKDISLFETLSSINERFSKLQDTLGAAMRHGAILSGEQSETFLRVLSFYAKIEVIESVESWQLCRTTRNLAAHDYGIDYLEIAEHFNALHELVPTLYFSARRFLWYCFESLGVLPALGDFGESFTYITQKAQKIESGVKSLQT
ncbi:MAG: hypothetical protein KKG10_03610 [Proteobacteria bacterium]|nr:hypothetical protein [Pseudomonadota bacterium]